jgi:hypothetical protein
MRTKILILGLIFILTCCTPAIIRQIKTYPQPTDFLFSQMILTLQDLGFTIKHTDKASFVILAEIKSIGDTWIGSNLANPFQISILFKEQEGGNCLSLTVTQPGEILPNKYAKKWSEKIIQKFEERIKNLEDKLNKKES